MNTLKIGSICCFSDAFFFSRSAYKGDSESKNVTYFSVRTLWMAP